MKYLFSFALAVMACSTSHAQSSILFTENFDPASGPDSVTIGNMNSTVTTAWNDTNFLSTSGTHSFHVQGQPIQQKPYFDTDTFSTVGNPFVRLRFDHIAKIFLGNMMNILISTDGGLSFDTLGPPQYFGKSTNFDPLGYFNSSSYLSSTGSPWQHINHYATPTSSWWRTEEFDLTGTASDTSVSGNFTGYPNVVIRFLATFSFPPGMGGYSPGWFVDNIKVVGGSCDFTSPDVELPQTLAGTQCIGNEDGLTSLRPSYYFQVSAGDNNSLGSSGLDSVSLFYSINGAPFTGVKLAAMTTSGHYEYSLTGLNAGDTLHYYFQAEDFGCSAPGRLPAANGTYRELVVASNIPAKCPSTNCMSPLVINSFPWTENFEGPEWQELTTGSPAAIVRGDMPVSPNGHFIVGPQLSADYGWSLKSGSTPTAYTGPAYDADFGAGGGGKYLYTEFTGQGGLLPTTFITPCIDLTDSVARMLSFSYHLFGSDINRLRIDIDTGNTTAVFQNNYFSIFGQQQFSSTHSWKKATLNLSPFQGKIIRIRFTVIAQNAANDKQDIAIDQLEIKNLAPRDLELTELVSQLNDACTSSSNIPLKVVITNMGQQVLDTIPVAFQLNSGAVQRDTLFNASLGAADSLVFTLAPSLSFNSQQNHQLKMWVELSADTDQSNDTLLYQIDQRPFTGSMTGPLHYAGFENPQNNNWQAVGTWDTVSYSNNDRKVSPYGQYTRSGHYLITGQDGARLESSCLDLTSMTNPVLSFAYASSGSLVSLLLKPENQPWQNISNYLPQAGSLSPKVAMKHARVNLNAYKGSSFQLALEIKHTSGATPEAMAALDHIQISEAASTDLILTDVNKTISKFLEGESSVNNMWFEGGAIRTGSLNYSFHLSFKNLCKSAPDITGSAAFTATGGSSIFEAGFSINLSDSLEAGRYLVRAWLENTGDINHANDTIEMQSVVAPIAGVPYFQDFDQCQYDFRTAGPLEQWEIRNPLNINTYSGSRAAVLNDFQALPGTENLLAPIFRITTPVYGAELRFYHTYAFNRGHGEVQIFSTSGWKNITQNLSQNAVNFPTTFIGSQPWHQSTYPLPEFAIPGNYALRFVADSPDPSTNGWAIDDFEIFVPEQHSASPVHNVSLDKMIPRQGNNQLTFSLKNTGAAPLHDVTATLVLNGTVQITEQFSFSILHSGSSRMLTFSQPLQLNQAQNQVHIITSLPNNTPDEIPTDDTLHLSLSLLPHYNTVPQCLDFEQEAVLTGIDAVTGSLGSLWRWGSPSKNIINTAHSGSKVWMTADSTYGPLTDQYLFGPSYAMDARQCYRFSFWHNYQTEYNFDGGTVEFTTDAGQNWYILGRYEDTTWYNTQHVQALDAIYPGFSGNSNGWRLAFQEFHSFYADTIQFRFRFASGATQHGEGWAIDDLCFEAVPGNCEAIDIHEFAIHTNDVQLYPNPAGENLFLEFAPAMQSLSRELDLAIYNQNGQLVKSWKQTTSLNEAAQIDISNLPPGVYMLKTLGSTEAEAHFVKRFVKY